MPLYHRFFTIPAYLFRGAHVLYFCFDVTDKQSFTSIKQWLAEAKNHAPQNVIKILVGCKCDLVEQRIISFEEVKVIIISKKKKD